VRPMDAQTTLETAVLAINLAHPAVRLSLEDLSDKDFTQEEHKDIFEAMLKLGKKDGADELIKALPSHEDYVRILELKGEQEYADLAPADCSMEGFTLVRNLRNWSNKRQLVELQHKLSEAEKTGNTELSRSLTKEFQTLMMEEI